MVECRSTPTGMTRCSVMTSELHPKWWLGRGFEPAKRAYKARMIPFHYPTKVVRKVGFEPTILRDFEFLASANFATTAWCPRRDSDSHAFAAGFKAAMSTISSQGQDGTPNGIQTRVQALKKLSPRSLDDRGIN